MRATLNFGKIDRVALFGGSWLMAALSRSLAKSKHKLLLFSSTRHLDDVVEKEGTTLRQVMEQLNLPYCATDDINSEPALPRFITSTTLGLALGAAWGFEKETAALFAGKLLDFMGIVLPQYRGGAHYTHQILRCNKQGCCNLQIVYGGRETFHKGEIIKRTEYFFPAEVHIPQDYFAAAVPRELAFLEEFFGEVAQGKDFALWPLQENFSTYFPFLYTLRHGFIDWSWSTEEIERFICAFDRPYAGASTFAADQRVFLKNCCAEYSDGSFHPFQAGLIYRKTENAVYVATRNGAIVARSVTNESGDNRLPDLQLGQRFYTPPAALAAAMQFDAVYDAKGVQSQNDKEVV